MSVKKAVEDSFKVGRVVEAYERKLLLQLW